MGALHDLKERIAPTSSAHLQAKIPKAESALVAANEAWIENESDAHWAAVENAKRALEQLRLRLRKAERLEQAAREEEAEKVLAAKRAEISAAVDRLKRTPTFVAETVAAVADLGAELAKHQKAILAHEDACSRDLRFIEDESRRLGVDPPRVDTTAPMSAVGIARMCGLAVRARNVKDGVNRDIEQHACELVRGST